jgi:hypothetical protein
MNGPLKLGVLLWSQATTWPGIRDVARRVDASATATSGRGITSTRSSATLTRRSSSVGLRSPGLGAAWFEIEHGADGYDFGTGFGQRCDWIDESAGVIRRLLDGETVTYASDRYRLNEARHYPLPVQPHLPIVIGGSGEKKTLQTVATYADVWNGIGTPEALPR